MAKKFELISLRKENGYWIASMYNRLEGYWKDQVFLYYTKKEVIWLLRHIHGCVVSKKFT